MYLNLHIRGRVGRINVCTNICTNKKAVRVKLLLLNTLRQYLLLKVPWTRVE